MIPGNPDLSGPLVGRTHVFAPTTKQYPNVYSRQLKSTGHGGPATWRARASHTPKARMGQPSLAKTRRDDTLCGA